MTIFGPKNNNFTWNMDEKRQKLQQRTFWEQN